LAAIIALGVAVRLAFLFRPLQYDEAATYNEFAAQPFLDAISRYAFANNHILNTILIHITTALAGPRPWAVRLPALAAGVLLIPSSYVMVARLCGRPAAILATALVAASAPLINYSTNARGYSLVCLITTLLVILAQRIAAGAGRARDWVAFTVLAALGFFTIPIMLYPYGGIMLWLAWNARPGEDRPSPPVRLDRFVASAVGTTTLTVLLYLPVLLRSGLAAILANPMVAPQPFAHVLRNLPLSLISAWREWHHEIPWVAAVAGLLAWLVSLRGLAPGRGGCGPLSGLFLMVLGWSLAVALAQRVVPFERVWLFALPLYAGCVGSGLAAALERLWGSRERVEQLCSLLAVLLGLVLGVAVVRGDSILNETRQISLYHADAIAGLLKPVLRPGDAVAASLPCDAPLKYSFLVHRIPVDYLHDYRLQAARRLFVAVEPPAGQTLEGILKATQVDAARYATPRVVRDFGASVLYEMKR
jgi:hypothetical protein